MGYLQLANLPAHTKAVIAFWFRVPGISFAAAAAQSADSTVPFAKKIPLLCWGKRKRRVEYNLSEDNVLTWHSPPVAAELLEQTWTSPHETDDLGPCYIAIDFNFGSPILVAHIQTDTTPSIVGYSYSATDADGWATDDLDNPYLADPASYAEGSGYLNGGTWTGICNEIVDTSYVLAATPARFDFFNSSILADRWHHVIISYDISNGVATHQVAYPNAFPIDTAHQTDTPARMWFAVDDVNIKMTDANGSVIGGGDNDIIPQEAQTIAQQSHATRTHDNLFTETATYTLSDPVVGAGTVGIPASSNYVSNIMLVEVAELQVFTGVTADTSITGTRRLFVTSDGTPETITSAATSLGSTPIIQLHGSKKWKAGQNTGSGGNLSATGVIDPYGNPSL